MQELSTSNEVGSDLFSHDNSHPLWRPMGSQSGRDKDIMNVYDPQSFERRLSSHEKGLKNSGSNFDSNLTSAVLYQLSYQANSSTDVWSTNPATSSQ